ncbi:MAG: ATP-binding protein [Acidimicrobiaceae bacterium]|nr:ATP-binding protein [Acidimicrobiaceae bacterium]MYE75608.1 ATP-binding protein [Acidimicrobiaceae bacterium]MYJ41322.1 ATP-binding protein [Acidimicrobiaceae bacterium]
MPERLSEDDFWNLFGRIEHQSLDFKRGVPDDILATIPAMAMTDGGLIVHGVADDRTIIGCPLSQNTADRIQRYARECDVEVRARPVQVGESEITVTEMPEIRGRVVTTPDGRLLRRVGGGSQPLRGDAHSRFIREREDRPGEEEPARGFRSDDVDLSVLNEVLAAEARPAAERDNALRALVDLGVALPGESSADATVLRAAAVLLARDPGKFFPTAHLLGSWGIRDRDATESIPRGCRGSGLVVVARPLSHDGGRAQGTGVRTPGRVGDAWAPSPGAGRFRCDGDGGAPCRRAGGGRFRRVLGDSDVTVTAVLHADAPAVGAFARCWAIRM